MRLVVRNFVVQNFLQHYSSWLLHDYFDGPTKLFSDRYLAKFLDTLEK